MRGSPSAQLRGNNTQAKLGAKRLGLRVIVPVSASKRLQLFVIPHYWLDFNLEIENKACAASICLKIYLSFGTKG